MRLTTLLIIICAVAGGVFGAYKVGHAVDGPAKQLDTVVSMPAQAASATAQASLTAAVSAAASYRIDHSGYAGMTTGDLRSYDGALASGVSVRQASAKGYCVESKADGAIVSISGPNGSFVAHGCA
jgi:hypothetical protein